MVVSYAYSVEVKARGFFSDDGWTEMEARHLAKFEDYLERLHWDRYSQDESIDIDDIGRHVHSDVHFRFHLDGFRTWLRRKVLKNDESSRHILYPHKRSDELSPDEQQFFSELRLGVLIYLGDVHPQTGIDVTYAPSRLAGVVGVPVRDQGVDCHGFHGGVMHSEDSDDGCLCSNDVDYDTRSDYLDDERYY